MSVVLTKAIIHILDTTSGVPILSDNLLAENEETNIFISEIIEKSFYSDDVKNCSFQEGSYIWEQCQNSSRELIAISHIIANQIFTTMRRNSEIPLADVIIGIAKIDGDNYLFMLKLDFKSAFTHVAQIDDGKKSVDIIRYKTMLPTQSAKISEGFFINLHTPAVKVMERKFYIDGIKDFYLSTQILSCSESKTPRQKTTKVLKVAEKVAELYYSKEDDMNSHISSTMFDELQQEQPLLVEKLGQKFFSNNPAAQKEFFERLEASDISKDETLPLSKQFQKKFQKQAIKTTSGVEIKIPTQVYSNPDEIEFINNPNGTISILIKNIQI